MFSIRIQRLNTFWGSREKMMKFRASEMANSSLPCILGDNFTVILYIFHFFIFYLGTHLAGSSEQIPFLPSPHALPALV
jgi:hypothetical protein